MLLAYNGVHLGSSLGLPPPASVLLADVLQLAWLIFTLTTRVLTPHQLSSRDIVTFQLSAGTLLRAVVAALLGLASSGLVAVLSNGHAANTAAFLGLLEGQGVAGSMALCAAAVLVGPAHEEILYRGFLLPSLTKHTGSVHGGILLSSLAFAAFHLSPADFPSLLVLGVVLGYSASAGPRGSVSLTIPVVAHSLYNTAVLFFH